MERKELSRTLVESVVDQSICAIREDPKRSVRKLVDLGEDLAKGEFQKEFFNIAQRMLQNDESPYYELIESAVNTIDNQKIRTFGINFGWGCLTVGAEQIRKLEKKVGYNIPWSITLHIGGGSNVLTSLEYNKFISESKQLGIFAYFLFLDDDPKALEMALEMVSVEKECVFFLFIPKNCHIARAFQCLTKPNNLMLCINSEGEHWKEDSTLLREKGCLYSTFRFYTNENEVHEIISGNWVEKIMPYAGIAAVCVAGKECEIGCMEKVYQYVTDFRLAQKYPIFLTDCYRDNLYTDSCISGESCFLGILSDGITTIYRNGCEIPTELSVRDIPLGELLDRIQNKKSYVVE